MLAYILTTSSRDYFTSLGASLGLYESSRVPWFRTGALFHSGWRRGNNVLQLDDVDFDQSSLSSDEEHLNNIPTFIPPELVDALPAARKSLRILQAADPNHPLCSAPTVGICEWVWSCPEVEKLWENQETSRCVMHNVPEGPQGRLSVAPGTPNTEYKPGLEQFRLFDLEPGVHLAESNPSGGSRAALSSFLAAFPERLPPLTPTLQHLATAVLQPVFMRTEVLSSSLLKLYLTSLHLETHLTLLRSYMLLTLPSFKVRLVEALFSDTDMYRYVGRGTRARTRARLGIQDERDAADAAASIGLGIGLGPGLTERDAWPPGGADLSFILRSVIVDSLEERTKGNKDADAEKVWRESEVRLGFALRDLPIANGRDRWLNLMCWSPTLILL